MLKENCKTPQISSSDKLRKIYSWYPVLLLPHKTTVLTVIVKQYKLQNLNTRMSTFVRPAHKTTAVHKFTILVDCIGLNIASQKF